MRIPETGQSDLWRLAHPLWSVEEPSKDDVARAEAVIEHIQDVYRRNEAFHLNEARTLVPLQELAIRTITKREGGSNKRAKETQIRVANGAPLAVCLGTLTIDRVWLGDGSFTVTSRRYGCGRVFSDTTRTSGRVWATTCDECRAKRSERRRAQKRLTKRRLSPRAPRTPLARRATHPRPPPSSSADLVRVISADLQTAD